MNFLSLLVSSVFAAQTVLSPIPDSIILLREVISQPVTSFGELTVTPTVTQTPTPAPPPKYATTKKKYTIALLGDSMIDTLGPDVVQLTSRLKTLFPNTSFSLLNYGVGSTNIDYGIERITNAYTYMGKTIPSLVSQSPDVVVVESFGYNPYPEGGAELERHWLALLKIVDILQSHLPDVKIVIAATIAPNSFVFGNGAAGISLNVVEKLDRTAVIKQYLNNTVRFAKSQHLPLADAYHASMDSLGNGKLVYINNGDHIHYSEAGRALFAQAVASAILNNHLFSETLLAQMPI